MDVGVRLGVDDLQGVKGITVDEPTSMVRGCLRSDQYELVTYMKPFIENMSIEEMRKNAC